jgi:hypothetical protein
MPPEVTVITASIPQRNHYLRDCLLSVEDQDPLVAAHLVRVEARPEGMDRAVHASTQLNELLGQVGTEWVSNLDDDDWLLPNFMEVMARAVGGADVYYSWGEQDGGVPHVNCNDWGPGEVLNYMVHRGNFISANGVLMRTSLLRRVGGWPTDWVGVRGEGGHFAGGSANWQDWALWLRLARAGAVFVCVPEVTWHYRRHNLQNVVLEPPG